MARKQSPSTVQARKLAVAMAKYWTRKGEPTKPNYDEAFRWVYDNSSRSGKLMTDRWIEALNADMDMVQTAQHMQIG